MVGVGIGVPGFTFANGVVDSTYGFLEFMEDYHLADFIEQQHDLPCLLDNDARVVALGEAVYGRGKGYNRVLVLTLGTGLGLGFTINGKLDGSLPFAHMGGHMTITSKDTDTVCYCGKTGCLESLVSASGIQRMANQCGWAEKYPDLPLTPEVIFAQKQIGNPDASAIVQAYVKYLGIGIGNYVNLYAPDLIVLGGGVAKGLANELSSLHNATFLAPFKAYTTAIALSELEEQAGILGSAALFNGL